MSSMLERFYPWVPVWVQNVGISLYGLAWRHERLGGDFARYVEEYRNREQWTKESMRGYLEAQLRYTLFQAFTQVPYYQQSWSAAGCAIADLETLTLESLHHLPITPKRALREQPEAFIAQHARRGEKLNRQLTSGSTGTPVTMFCTPSEHRQFIAAREARSFGWARASIRSPRAMIGGRLVVPKAQSKPPFHRYNLAEKQVYLSAYHIAPAHARSYVEALNRYQPPLLTGYAHSYFTLGRMMLEQGLGLDYRPQALVLSSEKLTPVMKRVIQQAFGARPYEEYGAVENCVLVTECEEGSLHVSPDFGVMEIVDSTGQPVGVGQEGRIVCTSLVKQAQPLIRYDLGDIGVWSGTPCACGRGHLPCLKEIIGRLEDVVVGPDGRELVRFHGIFVGLPHVAEAQVLQEKLHRFTVRVVPAHDYGARDEAIIRHRFRERLGSVEVRIELVTAIPRTERGKFRAVISHVRDGEPKPERLPAGNRSVS